MTSKRIQNIAEIISSAGEFAHGDQDPEKIAEEWDQEGFTPQQVREWLDSRTFIPRVAVRLSDEGVTPDEAGTVVNIFFGNYRDTLGYAVSNHDLSIGRALAIVKKQRR